MRYGRYKWSYVFLRIGLGAVFTWIGVDILRHPETWIGYVPPSLPGGLERELALKLNGLFDLALGLLFIADKMPRAAAALAVAHLAGILATQGIDAVLIRDAGLLGAALALLAWPHHHRRRHFLSQYMFWKRRSFVDEE